VDRSFLEALNNYHWPGNVRELENVVERAIILSRSDILDISDLPGSVIEAFQGDKKNGPENISGDDYLMEGERQALIKALRDNKGHRERTAASLGISRRSLQYKLKKHGLIRPY
jgi:two-component system NtrC family response regulator